MVIDYSRFDKIDISDDDADTEMPWVPKSRPSVPESDSSLVPKDGHMMGGDAPHWQQGGYNVKSKKKDAIKGGEES
jgi:hypothetical protein